MSEVFIPLGGAGGKNRGEVVSVDENYAYLKSGNSGVALPLPAGNYKAMKAVHGEESLFASYGDGKNAAVFMTKEFLKKVTLDYFGIASITNFSLTMYAHRQVRLTWAKPSEGLWSGVHFVFKYGSMPTSETDGFMQIDSADVYYTTDRLQETGLYVRAYNYVTVKDGRWYDDGAVSSHIRVTGINGAVTLSAGAGTWTVPEGVYKIRYIVVGQGGNGQDNGNTAYTSSAGGGGGYFVTGYMNVMPGQQLLYSIPVLAQGITNNQQLYSVYYRGGYVSGLDTIFTSIRAEHGRCASNHYGMNDEEYLIGGDGGSGGGGGNGGDGGRNGADGGQGGTYPYGWKRKPLYGVAGKGSHKSTTGFNGVRYCDGGAGGSMGKFARGVDGADGLGTGGGGASSYGHEVSRKFMGGGKGGTGCIYIAWGGLMNDGS